LALDFVVGRSRLLWTWWWISSIFSRRILPNAERALAAEDSTPSPARWIDLLKIRESWGLVSAVPERCGWYFYLFWLPEISTMRAGSM
jgi:hypothetical protein